MVALIVPWRPGDPHRETAWQLLKERHHHTHPQWPIIEGDAPEGPWCKALAVADALERTDHELLVIADADVWTDGLDAAVAAIGEDARWAIPHDQLYRLAEGRLEPSTERAHLAEKPYRGYEGGGVVVIDRTTYEACPLDPRFVGWGQEDASLAMALTCLYGAPWRGTAPLFHWWHPPQDRVSRVFGSREGRALHKRYKTARHTRTAMQSLIGEVWCGSGAPDDPNLHAHRPHLR